MFFGLNMLSGQKTDGKGEKKLHHFGATKIVDGLEMTFCCRVVGWLALDVRFYMRKSMMSEQVLHIVLPHAI